MALRTLWADTGLPTHLTFDAAQNITAAGTIFGGIEETEKSDLLSKQIAGNLGHLMDLRKPVPYAAHRQGLVERNVGLVKKQLKILLAPTAGAPLTRTQASHLLSQATAFINRRPLVVLGAADQLGHLSPWYLSSDNMSVNSSQLPDDALLNYHPLTKRAVELQTRLEVFKRDFNTFYARSLRSYGKWRNNNAPPSIGSIVYILDKTLPKQNFLQTFTVGKITRYLSDHTVELKYVKQSPEMTQGFIGSVRTGKPKTFSLKTCTRDLRSLGLLVDPSENSAWNKGVDIDQLMVTESVEPVDQAEHVEPVEPVDPVDPLEPVEPVDQANNVEPATPAEPEDPVETVEPAATPLATTTKASTRPKRTRQQINPHWHQ